MKKKDLLLTLEKGEQLSSYCVVYPIIHLKERARLNVESVLNTKLLLLEPRSEIQIKDKSYKFPTYTIITNHAVYRSVCAGHIYFDNNVIPLDKNDFEQYLNLSGLCETKEVIEDL